MALDVEFNFEDYKSDSIKNGRTIKKFFVDLSQNVFNNTNRYFHHHKELTGYDELPLLFGERNIYSIVASSVNQITPVHLSEWGFSKNDEKSLDASRRVDLWCLDRNGENGKPINYYIEIKKGHYCISSRSQKEFISSVVSDIKGLKKQLKDLKKMKPRFGDAEDVYLGLFFIHSYHSDNGDAYCQNNVHENFSNFISKREKQHVTMATWKVPEEYNVQWEKNKCKFISLIGVVQD